MEYQTFLGNLKCLEIPKNTKGHHYTIEEDLVAYYCARKGISNKDILDVLVMKMNRLKSSDLKLSSFSMRISNMNYSIYGRGNAHNSEQGKAIANFINKLLINKNLDLLSLQDYINKIYNEKIV